MSTTIFFSWQADTPTTEGRNLIERALAEALDRISSDTSVEMAIRDIEIDKDTKGVPGQPPIVETIFRKVDQCIIFLADLTFVGKRLDGRPTPNPNVLIEYGWALKSKGHHRIICVMNVAHGKPSAESLPFDLRHLRHPIQFDCESGLDQSNRVKVRGSLSRDLEGAIRAILHDHGLTAQDTQPEPKKFLARTSIERPGRFKSSDAIIGTSESYFNRKSADVKLINTPDVWFRLMPDRDPDRTWLITELKRAATEGAFLLHPLGHGWSSFDYLRGEDGFGVYPPYKDTPDETHSVVYAFESGEVWAVDSYVLEALEQSSPKIIPTMESDFRVALENYSAFLVKLGATPPFRWMAGMENLKGRRLYDPSGRMAAFRGSVGTCVRDVVTAEGLFSPGDSPAATLKPFFVKLFDSCGVSRSPTLDE
jgi:hypothetical protein